jgi:hypothetical protein
MTPKLTRIFALFRPCCKTDARCGWLPAAQAARTMVEELTAAKTGSNQVYDSAFSFNANAAKLYIEARLMSW